MRKLTYLVASTVDGFIADPSGNDPTNVIFPVEGDHMAALIEQYPELVPTHWREKLGLSLENKTFDAVLEGRKSYELASRRASRTPTGISITTCSPEH